MTMTLERPVLRKGELCEVPMMWREGKPVSGIGGEWHRYRQVTMRIYFCGSIRGGRADRHIYHELVSLLRGHGIVLSEHVATAALTAAGEGKLPDAAIFRRDKLRLRQADAVVAEVTVPSTGVGMELGYADEWRKPTLCLFRASRDQRLSAMVGGCPGFRIVQYTALAELPPILDGFFMALH
jgi:nucleoside 2-deoxyribosyltransferase